MSTSNAKKGSAIEPRPTQETTAQAPVRRHVPGTDQNPGPLLAQIPDLDPKVSPQVPAKRADGRLISQSLSTKVIFGVGLGLVIGAILPFFFGKASRREAPVSELPTWSNAGSPSGLSRTSPDTAPAWPAAPIARAATAFPAQRPAAQTPAILYAQAPQAGDARPTGLSEPAWPATRSSAARPATLPPPPGYTPAPLVNTPPRDNRGYGTAVNRGNMSADNRNDPASLYRNNDLRYDYRATAPAANPVRRDVPAPAYGGDNRYENVNTNYPPQSGPSSPLMPSGPAAAPPGYRDQQYSDPGVARFDGTIAAPPPR